MTQSNSIAAVTMAIQELLGPVAEGHPGAGVSSARPDRLDKARHPRGLNVYLFGITPNSSLRSSDLPTRSPDGALATPPTGPMVDLHYLISAHGDDEALEPQRLLTGAIAAIARSPLIDARYAGAERVVVQLEPLAPEAIAKLWRAFQPASMALSVGYRCTGVRIEPDLSLVQS